MAMDANGKIHLLLPIQLDIWWLFFVSGSWHHSVFWGTTRATIHQGKSYRTNHAHCLFQTGARQHPHKTRSPPQRLGIHRKIWKTHIQVQ